MHPEYIHFLWAATKKHQTGFKYIQLKSHDQAINRQYKKLVRLNMQMSHTYDTHTVYGIHTHFSTHHMVLLLCSLSNLFYLSFFNHMTRKLETEEVWGTERDQRMETRRMSRCPDWLIHALEPPKHREGDWQTHLRCRGETVRTERNNPGNNQDGVKQIYKANRVNNTSVRQLMFCGSRKHENKEDTD